MKVTVPSLTGKVLSRLLTCAERLMERVLALTRNAVGATDTTVTDVASGLTVNDEEELAGKVPLLASS